MKLAGELYVALRKESVDRNFAGLAALRRCLVALRKESVDRNIPVIAWERAAEVALRKESVDRNIEGKSLNVKSRASLSARRAWIEISRG